MALLGIELLGGFRLTCDGQPASLVLTSRLQELLAYLALHASETISREYLAFLFWPESEESQAKTNLRQLLHHLKAALPDGDAHLMADGGMIQWRAPIYCDVAEFEAAAARGDWARAVRLYRGHLMPGSYEEWLDVERQRLKQKHAEIIQALMAQLEQSGDFAQAIVHAEAAVAADPLQETAYQSLMRLHMKRGDRAAALRVFAKCEAELKRELGIEPSAQTRRLRDEARREDVSPSPAPVREISFVGREDEWARLLHAWRQAEAGQSGFVVVTGEAGIGKTRLLAELAALAAANGATVARTACYAAEKPLAFAPAADWLRNGRIQPLLPSLPPAFQAQLARVLPELPAARDIANVPRPYTEEWDRRQFFEAISAALMKAPPPLLLLIDDLQWCDPETLDWLHLLLRANPNARLLAGGTVRLDESSASHPIRRTLRELLRVGQAVEIELGPLSPADTTLLAAQVGGSTIDSASLFEHTRGNPLFVLETVRSGLAELPPLVHTVITARLAQLSEPARELAGLAAAFGRPVSTEMLVATGGGDEESVARSVDELWQRRILLFDGAGAYDFSHGQLREVAYREVGPARRRLLHRRIAAALEKTYAGSPDIASAQTAWHFERAGIVEKAIAHYAQAARIVRQRYADQEAIRYLTGALNLVEGLAPGPGRDRIELDLLLDLGPCLSAIHGYASTEAGNVYRRARMLCEARQESERYMPVLAGSWGFHVVRGELEVGLEIGARYLALANQRNDPLQQTAGMLAYGAVLGHMGQVRKGMDHVRAALDQLEGLPAERRLLDFGPDIETFCGSYDSHFLWWLGRPEESVSRSRKTIAKAEALAHPFSLALALAYAAMLHQFRDEADLAEQQAEAAAELCRKHGFRYYLAWTPIILGWARSRKGDRDGGLAIMKRGYEELRATGAEIRAGYYLGLLAQAYQEAGRKEEALLSIENAFAQGQKNKEAWYLAELNRIRGDLLLHVGETSEAMASYRAALRVAREQEAKGWQRRAEARLEAARSRI